MHGGTDSKTPGQIWNEVRKKSGEVLPEPTFSIMVKLTTIEVANAFSKGFSFVSSLRNYSNETCKDAGKGWGN